MSALLMLLILIVGLGIFASTAARRWKLMFAAKAPAVRSDDPARRVRQVLRYVFGQARMFRYRGAGIAHALIFGGFVVLALRTIVLVARGFTGYCPVDFYDVGYRNGPGFGFWIFDDNTWLGAAYLFVKDLVGVGVIVGVAYFLIMRLVVRPKRIELSREGVLILLLILALMLADMVYEATAIIMTSAGGPVHFEAGTPAAGLLALAMKSVPPLLLTAFHHLGFWAHTVLVLAFLNFLPRGKHFHVLTVIPQVYFSNPQPRGRLAPLQDIEGRIERSETLGVRTARDLSWKSVLDLYTCTECGRCSDNCPAFNTGKLLSPKHLTMQLRGHFYSNERTLVGESKPAAPPAEGESAPAAPDLVPAAVEPEMIWACTTCGACEQECPVFISYIDKIVDMRRHVVMERGEFPEQLQNAFRGLETVGNPYSFANEQRADWAAGLDIPLRSEKPDAEILYWVGCAPSFDDRSRKIARAAATLLKLAGVDFAILGPEERCTGDPARRAGNEYLFQMFAQGNIETLNGYGVKKIITTCPHCFNTLKNEYPDFGGNYEVIHHTDFLLDLVRAGKLKPQHAIAGSAVFHDSCYLGRHNDLYDAPRELLKAIPGLSLCEAEESRDRGMCCGAGGAQMWKEEEHTARPGSREGDGKVNHARARQLLRVLPQQAAAPANQAAPSANQPGVESNQKGTPANQAGGGCGSRTVATACPFCMTMLRDGLADQGHEDVQALDVAELLLKSVQGS